jgi:hypothetical protein
VRRGTDRSYKIVPVTEFDTIISKEYILEPDEDLARAITVKEFLAGAKEDIREIFREGKR